MGDVLAAMIRELDLAKQAQTAANSRVTYLQKVVDGLMGLNPPVQPKPEASVATVPVMRQYPKPREAVLDVLRAHPNEGLLPKTVVAEVKQNGSFDPSIKSKDNAYTTALRRLLEDRKVTVKQDFFGQYMLVDSSAQPVPSHVFHGEA